MRRSRLVADVGQLVLAAAASRLLGLAYRVLLARTIGAEGLGIFQLALPIYLVALTLSSMGLSLGVTQRVAAAAARGDLGGAARVRRQAAILGGLAAAAGALALQLLAPRLALALLHDPRAAGPLAVMAWALPFAVVEGIYRGYWQGLHRMSRVGAAQVGENVVRLGGLALWAALLPLVTAATGAEIAAALLVVGEGVELAAVTVAASRDPLVAPPAGPVPPLGGLLRLSLPVAMSRVAGTLGLAVDAALIPAALRAGGADAITATAAFGQLLGMVMPLVTFPTVLIGPLATALVPSVSEAVARRSRQALARSAALSAAAAGLLAVATSAVLLLAPGDLGRLLYGRGDLGPLLMTAALIPPGLYLAMPAAAILNGLGRTSTALGCQLLGGALRVALIIALVPRLGIDGAAAASAAGFAVTAAAAWAATAAAIRRT